jgi:hypothetical protein
MQMGQRLFGNARKRFFFEKRSKKLLISVGFASVSAKCFRESKFFCFFLLTKRRSYSPFDVSKQPLSAFSNSSAAFWSLGVSDNGSAGSGLGLVECLFLGGCFSRGIT